MVSDFLFNIRSRLLVKLTLKLGSSLTNNMREVLEIISSGDSETANKILGRILKITITVVNSRELILGPAEVGIAGNRGCAAKVLQSLLSLSLGGRVISFTTKELIR